VSTSPHESASQPLEAAGPNAQQIEYWNEAAGPRWVEASDFLDAQIGGLGLQAIDRAAPAAGDRVIDVGCGTGQTSAQLGERVGPSGSVLGIDISAVMLARAQARARRAGLMQVTFANADAQTHDVTGAQRDLLFSRFGVMFFADPRAAFANLRRALRPAGRLCFLCWQELGRNPWMLETIGALARHVPLPAPPEPGAPGPFAFADPVRVTEILEGAGFENVAHEALEQPMAIGGGGPLEEAVEFMLGLGPASAALREFPEKREAVAASLREVLERHVTPEGIVMEGAAWIVTARNPD
jgi:SAM-dependent methyltransferase